MVKYAQKFKGNSEKITNGIVSTIEHLKDNPEGVKGSELKEKLEDALLENNLLDDLSWSDHTTIVGHLGILGES